MAPNPEDVESYTHHRVREIDEALEKDEYDGDFKEEEEADGPRRGEKMEDQFREERNDERAKAAQRMVSEMKNEEKEDDDDLDVSLSAARIWIK